MDFRFYHRVFASIEIIDLQMIRRRKQKKLPLQAHFYPMPSAAFIEDKEWRVSLLGRQALGVASLKSGKFSHKEKNVT